MLQKRAQINNISSNLKKLKRVKKAQKWQEKKIPPPTIKSRNQRNWRKNKENRWSKELSLWNNQWGWQNFSKTEKRKREEALSGMKQELSLQTSKDKGIYFLNPLSHKFETFMKWSISEKTQTTTTQQTWYILFGYSYVC